MALTNGRSQRRRAEAAARRVGRPLTPTSRTPPGLITGRSGETVEGTARSRRALRERCSGIDRSVILGAREGGAGPTPRPPRMDCHVSIRWRRRYEQRARRPAPRKGPRATSWAFSNGKRPQNAGKRGRLGLAGDRRKPLQIGLTQKQLHTTENRGVPGSSPGLAIAGIPCKSATSCRTSGLRKERLRANGSAQSPKRSPNGPTARRSAALHRHRRRGASIAAPP